MVADDPVLLAQIDDPQAIGPRLTLTDRIRGAKEAISEAASAAIVVSAATGTRVLQLTRDEFGQLIGADIDCAVALTKDVLAEANSLRPAAGPVTIYLTGGSSAIPLVHARLANWARSGSSATPKPSPPKAPYTHPQRRRHCRTGTRPTPRPARRSGRGVPSQRIKRNSGQLAVFIIAAIAGIIPPITMVASNFAATHLVWYSQTLSLIVLAIAFAVIALHARAHLVTPGGGSTLFLNLSAH